MLITKDRNYYKMLLSISIPIAIQNLITFAVSMSDTLMLGRLGEIQLAAASIGNNLFYVLMVLMFGLAGGSNVLIAQYYGKKDINTIHKVMSISYRTCILITSIFIFIAMVIPEQFASFFSHDKEVIKATGMYLRTVSIGYIFYALSNITIMMLRAVKTVKISLIVYSISLLVNIFFNWVFIFGNLGAKPLGVQGAAIGTVIARITEFTIVLMFMIFSENKIKLKIHHIMKVDKIMLKDFITNTVPVLLNELLWSLGATMISVIIAKLGTETVAANSINTVVFQFVTVFIFGLSNSSAVIIGNAIGEGKTDKAKEYSLTVAVFSIIMGILSGLIIYLVKPIVVDFYNVSETTKQIASTLMDTSSILIVFQSLSVNMMMGVLRGGGDSKFVLIVDVLFMWTVSIPCGFIAVNVWGLPAAIVFLIVKSDEILKSFICLYRVVSGKWVKDVTRDFSEA